MFRLDLKTVASVLAGLVLAACGSAPSGGAGHEMEATGENGWVIKGGRIYQEGDRVIVEGVGSSQGIRNVALARETSESRARAAGAPNIESVISRMREDYMNSISDLSPDKSLEEQMVRVTGKEFTFQAIAGCQIVDRHFDKDGGVQYALAKLDTQFTNIADKFKASIRPVVAERIKQNAEEALKRLDGTVERYLKEGIPAAERK